MCVPPRSSARDRATGTIAADTPITTIPTSDSKNGSNRSRKPSWREERQRQVDALNVRVQKLTKVAIANAEKSGKPLDPEYVFAQQPMTALVAGTPVYQVRSAALVYLYCLVAFVLVVCGMSKISFLATAMSMIITFLGYDLYSGVLHVVLDHPDNISLPILGQPCLEFQWHHAIPDDLIRKDFVDVCGDLNVVSLILAITYCFLLDVAKASGVAMVIVGTKLYVAYFGQYSHRSAHSFARNAPVAEWLQKKGIIISPKDHLSHHKAPHDTDFCLIGVCNPIIMAMRDVTINNAVWLTMFLVWSVIDIVVYVNFVEWVIETIEG